MNSMEFGAIFDSHRISLIILFSLIIFINLGSIILFISINLIATIDDLTDQILPYFFI
jgi:hypothetical protein